MGRKAVGGGSNSRVGGGRGLTALGFQVPSPSPRSSWLFLLQVAIRFTGRPQRAPHSPTRWHCLQCQLISLPGGPRRPLSSSGILAFPSCQGGLGCSPHTQAPSLSPEALSCPPDSKCAVGGGGHRWRDLGEHQLHGHMHTQAHASSCRQAPRAVSGLSLRPTGLLPSPCSLPFQDLTMPPASPPMICDPGEDRAS